MKKLQGIFIDGCHYDIPGDDSKSLAAENAKSLSTNLHVVMVRLVRKMSAYARDFELDYSFPCKVGRALWKIIEL